MLVGQFRFYGRAHSLDAACLQAIINPDVRNVIKPQQKKQLVVVVDGDAVVRLLLASCLRSKWQLP